MYLQSLANISFFTVVQEYSQQRQRRKEEPEQYPTPVEAFTVHSRAMEEPEKLALQLDQHDLLTDLQEKYRLAVDWRQ